MRACRHGRRSPLGIEAFYQRHWWLCSRRPASIVPARRPPPSLQYGGCRACRGSSTMSGGSNLRQAHWGFGFLRRQHRYQFRHAARRPGN
ncbi:hypothetical protein HBB16_11475 [Pseudonocardia sp. MCCB 268]|nr:hypothetical protein [Pseudonocardia cytotoxica]